jgi:ribonuclease R
VTKFGLFIKLAETGADGLIPVSTLGGEYYVHDERSHALVGERSGKRWPLGLAVTVRLAEATPVTGGLLFHMVSEPEPALEGATRPSQAGNFRRPGGGPGGRPGFRTPPKDKGARGKNTPKKKSGARKR